MIGRYGSDRYGSTSVCHAYIYPGVTGYPRPNGQTAGASGSFANDPVKLMVIVLVWPRARVFDADFKQSWHVQRGGAPWTHGQPDKARVWCPR